MILKKIWSFTRWGLVMLISLFGWVTSKVVFPLLYPFRKFITAGKFYLFYYYFDAEDGYYGSEKFLSERNRKKNFITAYIWNAWRNPAWNLQASLKPKEHGKKIDLRKIVSYKGIHHKNSNYDISLFEMCVLKTLSKDGTHASNFGKILDKEHTILGKLFVWYKVGKRLYWRYSSAGVSKNRLLNWIGDLLPRYKYEGVWYYEIQLGVTNERYTWRAKRRKLKQE